MTTVYGVRVKQKDGTWKRVKTLRNLKGEFGQVGARYMVNKLRKRGRVAHSFAYEVKVQYPTVTHYSKNFNRAELECECGCAPSEAVEANLTELAVGLEAIREELGGSGLGVISAHRCKARNEAVGGAKNSRHIYGEAADLAVPEGKQDEYVAAAMEVGIFRRGGIGVYPHGGVHVDHRPWVARWDSWQR